MKELKTTVLYTSIFASDAQVDLQVRQVWVSLLENLMSGEGWVQKWQNSIPTVINNSQRNSMTSKWVSNVALIVTHEHSTA